MPLIALYDFVPHFCPNCGKPTTLFDRPHADADYRTGASHECQCGLMFALADKEHLIDAADASGSDIAQYIRVK